MSKAPRSSNSKAIVKRVAASVGQHGDFVQVLSLIESARVNVAAAANTALIDLYWSIGQYISQQIADKGWGRGRSRHWLNTSAPVFPTPAVSRPAISGG